MIKRKIIIGFATIALLASSCAFAKKPHTITITPPTITTPELSPWYAYIGTGFAWSRKTGISNPDLASWDAANEGYDSDLGNDAFYSFGLGRNIVDFLRADISYTAYATLHYQKYQTGSSSTPGYTGNARTRYFDIDNKGILLNFTLQPPPGKFEANFAKITVLPFASVGLGIGINRMTNFHTISSDGVNTSIGDPKTTTNFAWQGSLGLTMHPDKSHLFLDFGYRYYDGGKFKSSDTIVNNTIGGSGTKAAVKAWEGRLKTDQLFATFRYAF